MILVSSIGATHPAFADEEEPQPEIPMVAAAGGVIIISPTPGCRDPQASNYISVQQSAWIQNTPSLCIYGTAKTVTVETNSATALPTQPALCPLSDTYYELGDSGDGVKKLQEFLNSEMGLSIPLTGYFGPITEAGVRAFQQKYSDVIIKPWNPLYPTGSTGRWYKLTLGTAKVLSGCTPSPVTLEGTNTTWDFSAVVKK